MGLAPIGVVTALSKGSVIIAVILGLSAGRERLELHQKVGLAAERVCGECCVAARGYQSQLAVKKSLLNIYAKRATSDGA